MLIQAGFYQDPKPTLEKKTAYGSDLQEKKPDPDPILKKQPGSGSGFREENSDLDPTVYFPLIQLFVLYTNSTKKLLFVENRKCRHLHCYHRYLPTRMLI